MFLLGQILGKQELVTAFPAFILLLAATWLRTHAETLYYALFVERRDRAISLGNLLFIPVYGLTGLGLAALMSAIGICAWRWAHASAPDRALNSRNPLRPNNKITIT